MTVGPSVVGHDRPGHAKDVGTHKTLETGRPIAPAVSGRTARRSGYAARPSGGHGGAPAGPRCRVRLTARQTPVQDPGGVPGARGWVAALRLTTPRRRPPAVAGRRPAGGNRVGTVRGSHLPSDLRFCASEWEQWEPTSTHAHRDASFYVCTGVRGGWFPPFPRFGPYPQVRGGVGTGAGSHAVPTTEKGRPVTGRPFGCVFDYRLSSKLETDQRAPPFAGPGCRTSRYGP